MAKRVLMVAFEFPPSNGASVQRITSVYREFLEQGYIVDVLTNHPFSYAKVAKGSENDLPDNPHGKIIRALSIDALEQLSFKGKHFGSLMNPDRYGFTWCITAMMKGTSHLKRNKTDLIWSSAPIPSVHKVAGQLSEKFNISWAVDYRDPLPYMHGRESGNLASVHKEIDVIAMKKSILQTYATGSIKQLYEEVYPSDATNGLVIENGFNEHVLQEAKRNLSEDTLFKKGKMSFYYAGVLYKNGRDPLPFFDAISEYIKTHNNQNIDVVFQGAGNGLDYIEYLASKGLDGIVRFESGVSAKQALSNMLHADVLLIIQDELFNNQIPGKVYEYLATGKPVLLKAPSTLSGSATSAVVDDYKGTFIGYTANELYLKICDIFNDIKHNEKENDPFGRFPSVLKHSRKKQAEKLLENINSSLDLKSVINRKESEK